MLWVNKDVPWCSPSLEACSSPAPARKAQANARLAESTNVAYITGVIGSTRA